MRVPGWRAARFLLAIVLRNVLRHTDFLSPLELYHTAIMDHQLDRAEADRAESCDQFAEYCRRQREIAG